MQVNHLERPAQIGIYTYISPKLFVVQLGVFCMFLFRIAGHPLAQNERCLHMFLQEESIDRNYIPGKVRQ